jgi:hypothetical protein
VLDALRKGEPYRRWLLIFDNADQPENLNEIIPGLDTADLRRRPVHVLGDLLLSQPALVAQLAQLCPEFTLTHSRTRSGLGLGEHLVESHGDGDTGADSESRACYGVDEHRCQAAGEQYQPPSQRQPDLRVLGLPGVRVLGLLWIHACVAEPPEHGRPLPW